MFTVRLFEAKTLSWWAGQRERIDFEPPYQRRGGLWSRRDKAFLIDSILNEYDIPKVYVADFTFGPSKLNRKKQQYAVIDGKQRFESIFDFIDGQITLLPEFVYAANPRLSLGGLGYRDLKQNFPDVASQFDNYNLTVMSVITDEEGKINELFVRLNRNKTLTGPEIRNAMQGQVPELIRELAKLPLFTECVAFSRKRGQDLDIAGKFLLTEFRGQIVETKRANLDRMVEDAWNADADLDDLERAAKRVRAVAGRMQRVFVSRDPLLRTQGPLVPYYWFVRTVPVKQHRLVRPFLIRFEDLRAANRKLARDIRTVASADPELLRYDALNRSINDQGSIEGRYEILLERFREFAAVGDLAPRTPDVEAVA